MMAIGVGVIGLGMMGRTHLAAYERARRAGNRLQLMAVADPRVSVRFDEVKAAFAALDREAGEPFEWAKIRCYQRAEDLLADPLVRLVSVCTYVDSHVELASAALAAGKHVLVEKPVALRAADCAALARAARAADRLCMPAMCLRFWPAWRWVRERIRERAFGEVVSARFVRLGGLPDWAPSYYLDSSRSGDAIFDLHVHDVDFLHWCFGAPSQVVSTGDSRHVTTLYRYQNGPRHVVAEGGWLPVSGYSFHMSYEVVFERAVARYESARQPALTVLERGIDSPVSLAAGDGYDGEVRHLLAAIGDRRIALDATLEEAEAVTLCLAREIESLERGGSPVRVE